MKDKPYKRPKIDELSAIDVIKESWQIMNENLSMLFMTLILPLLVALPVLVILVVAIVWGAVDSNGEITSVELSGELIATIFALGLLTAAALVVITILYVGASRGVLVYLRTGKKYSFKQAWEAGKTYFIPSLTTGLLAGVIIFAGIIAFLLPGIIASFLFMLVGVAVVDGYKNIAALKRSKDLVSSNITLVLLIFLALIGLSFVLSFVPIVNFLVQFIFQLLFVCVSVYIYWVLAGEESKKPKS